MFRIKLLTIFSACALSAAACSSIPGAGGLSSGGENYAAGSPVGAQLSGGDRGALAEAVVRAVETGENQTWRGRNAVGVVMPKSYSLANLKYDPRVRLPLAARGVDLNQKMETDMGLYVLTRNSNIRLGPGTEHKIAEVLPSGAGVDVVGRVVDKEWTAGRFRGAHSRLCASEFADQGARHGA